jgi:hypothetical protein
MDASNAPAPSAPQPTAFVPDLSLSPDENIERFWQHLSAIDPALASLLREGVSELTPLASEEFASLDAALAKHRTDEIRALSEELFNDIMNVKEVVPALERSSTDEALGSPKSARLARRTV